MVKIFDWSKIDTNKTSGKVKLRCPECSDTRTDKKDKSLAVDLNEGIAKCFYCESLSFRENIKKNVEFKYTLPSQNWSNYTNISDKLVKWLEDNRRISQSTVINLGVTEELFYQPKDGKEMNNVVFNYFEGDVVVNKKYRSSTKNFSQSTNGKPIFYNINSAVGSDEVYIVEGEFDVLALYEIGVKNAISVPNGANDNDSYWLNSEPYLKEVKKFFIATDDDEKGNILADKIAQRLGRWKCERINFQGKDANEDLVSGVLEESIKNRTSYPVSGTFKVEDLLDDIMNLHDNGFPETIYPKHHSFGRLKDKFSVMRGHLITGTGIPSHGKSSFTEWYILNLVNDYDMKASFFSPEHSPLSLHQATIMQRVIGKNFFQSYPDCPRINKEDILKYKEWANEKIYLTAPDNNQFPTWDWLLEKFKEQMFCYGVDIFVIDAFNKLDFSTSGNKLEQINKVLTKLTMFAQMNNVIIFLIAHPTKMNKNAEGIYDTPTLYDVAGSADFRNQTHDGFCIYRTFGDESFTTFTNLKTKMSFQGEIGSSIDFDYHIPSGRYYERGTQPPTYSLMDYKYQESNYSEESDIIKDLPLTFVASVDDAFDIDSVPF